MNFSNKINSLTKKKFFKEIFSTFFWAEMITFALLVNIVSSLGNSTADWISDKIFLTGTFREVFKLILLGFLSYLNGRYVISRIFNFVFSTKDSSIYSSNSILLSVVNFLYSRKNCREVFEPIVVDWQDEYFEALFKKEIWKSRWINVRYAFAFLGAMWQKSPIGDLIEFVSKIAK